MPRYSLVILVVLCTLSLAYRALPQGPSMRLLVGPLGPAELSILQKEGASFQSDNAGFTIKVNDAGMRALYAMREFYSSSRDHDLQFQARFQPVDLARRQIYENSVEHSRLQQNRSSLYDRALRKMEARNPNLLVWHPPVPALNDDGIQMEP